MSKRSRHFLPLAASFLLGAAGSTLTVKAEHPVRNDTRRDALSQSSYGRLRQMAHELDETAQHANAQAQQDQGNLNRRDTKFLKSVEHFASRTRKFDQRLDSYQTQRWNVDEELRHLLRDARNVQSRLRRARFADAHTHQDWDRAVALLNQMIQEYQTGTSGTFSHDVPTTTLPYPDNSRRRGDHGSAHPIGGGYSETSSDIRQLARELEDRASRASELAGRSSLGTLSSSLDHFRDQARSFRSQLDSGRPTSQDIRSNVAHLLEDAQGAQNELSRRNVSYDLRSEWNEVIRVLQRMRDVAAG